MTQRLNLVKLDKRHNGRQWFTHRAEFEGDWRSRSVNFVTARNWLQERFCHSAELTHLHTYSTAPTWAWDSEHGRRIIYLTGSTLTQFILAKEQFEKDFA